MSINTDSPPRPPMVLDDARDHLGLDGAAGDPMDIDTGTVRENEAATLIQTAFRSYRVRKHLSPEICKEIQHLKADCTWLQDFMGQVQGRLYQSFMYRLMDQPEYNSALDKLTEARDDLVDLRARICDLLKSTPSITLEEMDRDYS
ncbi:MAG: IQ calmodulin-binding motif-containing protein, partial [Chlamydiia bacterium]|nr:IQ calmodulin-binding motif-containing protein [Chlamydiia bacterium]